MSMIRTRIAILAGLGVLSACSGTQNQSAADNTAMMSNDMMMMDNGMAPNTQMAVPTDDAAAATPTDAADYLKVAGAGDLFERQAGQLAVSKTDDPDVRAFAQQMIDDHTKTTDALKAAAKTAGLTVSPPQLTPAQQQQLDQLKQLDGDGFDRAYLDQQVAAHRAALALHRTYAGQGDTPALKDAASKTVPIIEGHLEHVQKLAAR
jgi:putative membrane protein